MARLSIPSMEVSPTSSSAPTAVITTPSWGILAVLFEFLFLFWWESVCACACVCVCVCVMYVCAVRVCVCRVTINNLESDDKLV